jgi:hypothetical protein
MIKVGSYTGDLDNKYYKNKAELIEDLMTYGGGFDEEEDEYAIKEGFKNLEEKLMSWTVKELVDFFEFKRG